MKKCGKCGQEKLLDNFSWRNKNKQVKNTWCRLCMKSYDYNRQVSKVYQARKYQKVKDRQRVAKEYVWTVLSNTACVDCGMSDPLVLQFDHRNPKEKLYNVSEMFGCSIINIQKEIDKCDIRCANCHVIRTSHQFGFWKSLK